MTLSLTPTFTLTLTLTLTLDPNPNPNPNQAAAAGAPLRFLVPLVAGVALSRSPAELALVAWLGSAGAL